MTPKIHRTHTGLSPQATARQATAVAEELTKLAAAAIEAANLANAAAVDAGNGMEVQTFYKHTRALDRMERIARRLDVLAQVLDPQATEVPVARPAKVTTSPR